MKLGFGLNNLGASQLAFHFIRSANRMASESIETDVVGFFEAPSSPCILPSFSTMQFAEAWAFDGTLVATSLGIAEKFLRFPCASRRYFYVWDLEWMRNRKRTFRQLASVYRNPSHILIARSDEHANVISKAWNVKVPHVVPECDVGEILRCIGR